MWEDFLRHCIILKGIIYPLEMECDVFSDDWKVASIKIEENFKPDIDVDINTWMDGGPGRRSNFRKLHYCKSSNGMFKTC